MTTLQLANVDARLAFLAVQYHLARPGSELDRTTGQASAQGLGAVAAAIEPQLERAVATVELGDEQRDRLLSAVSGAINELKAYPMMAASGRSSVPAFHDALRRLFPEVAAEPDEATALAGHLLALRRRLEQLPVAGPVEEAASGSGRPWWRFWRRRPE